MPASKAGEIFKCTAMKKIKIAALLIAVGLCSCKGAVSTFDEDIAIGTWKPTQVNAAGQTTDENGLLGAMLIKSVFSEVTITSDSVFLKDSKGTIVDRNSYNLANAGGTTQIIIEDDDNPDDRAIWKLSNGELKIENKNYHITLTRATSASHAAD